MQDAIKKADVLIEALPYIKQFHKKVTVIKYGGSILSEDRVRKAVLEDIAFLRYTGIRPILVHGGGPNITDRLRQMKIPTQFHDGIRVTDKATLQVVEEELNSLNKMIVEEIKGHGVKAVGFTRAHPVLSAVKKKSKRDLGFVGELTGLNQERIQAVLPDSIPVICPMAIGEYGDPFNINADDAAAFIGSRLNAEKLVFLTNVRGVLGNASNPDSLLSHLSVDKAEDMFASKAIAEGMIPKVKAAISGIKSGINKAHIIDAKIPHAILLEIFTDEGIGTEIVH